MVPLLLLALLALTRNNHDETTDRETEPTTVNENQQTNEPAGQNQGGALTSLAAIAAVTDRSSLADRTINLKNVKVESVTADKVFYVGTGNERMLVYLEEKLDAGAAEQQIDVDAGQMVNIMGTAKNLPSPADLKSTWGLTDAEIQSLQNNPVYIMASSVDIMK